MKLALKMNNCRFIIKELKLIIHFKCKQLAILCCHWKILSLARLMNETNLVIFLKFITPKCKHENDKVYK